MARGGEGPGNASTGGILGHTYTPLSPQTRLKPGSGALGSLAAQEAFPSESIDPSRLSPSAQDPRAGPEGFQPRVTPSHLPMEDSAPI